MATFRRSGGRRGRYQVPTNDAHRINDKITAREVRLIGATGDQLGILSYDKAIAEAEDAGLDLVEVSPNSKPPVCRLMDYGKFKYKEQKKEAEARKKRTENNTKELRIRYRTDVGDLETKLNKARGFLESGDKVKFSMRFKGREVAYVNMGAEKFTEIANSLEDISTIEERSPNGKMMYIIFAPEKDAIKKATTA